jgi:hypothetical protein
MTSRASLLAVVLASCVYASSVDTAAASPAALAEKAIRPTLEKSAGGPWVVASTDQHYRLQYGARGGTLHGPTGKKRALSMPGMAYRVAIAPDGNRVAYTSEKTAATRVIDVKTNTIVWSKDLGVPYSGLNVGFLDATTLVVSTACRVLRFDVTDADAEPEVVGATRCDEAKDQPRTDDPIVSGRFLLRRFGADEPTLLDAKTGDEQAIAWTLRGDVAVAADGSMVCSAQRYDAKPDVLCAAPGEKPRVVIAGVPRAMAMSPDGRQVVALVVGDDASSELVVADPSTGDRRSLGTTTDTRVFALGDDVATAHGPDGGATLWRPELGYRTAFVPGREIDAVWPAADPTTVVVSVARGASNVYYTARFP